MHRGRIDEAKQIVDAAEREVMRRKGLDVLPHAEPVTIHLTAHNVWHQTKELFTKYPGRVALGAFMNFSQVALGYGSIAYASLVLFPTTKTPPEVVPFYMTIAFVFAFFRGMTSMFMVDTVGRKVTGILSYGAYPFAALSMLFVNSPTSALVSLCIMQFVYTWGWVTEYVIKSEIFPTRIRAAGIGWCTFFGRLGGVIAPPLLSGVYQSTKSLADVAYVLAIFISGGFVAACFWAKKGIEGKHKALEELVSPE
jgi:MFS family permease